jgi:catechol 2,3-dioxygenase-like lactoylglutathione lyase family enzyme
MTHPLRFGFAIMYTKDIEATVRFYKEVMGLRAVREHPVYVQFEGFAVATDGSISGANLELYWLSDDAKAAFESLPEGTDVFLPLTPKPFGLVFGVRDPNGEPRFVLEFAKDRPSKEVA